MRPTLAGLENCMWRNQFSERRNVPLERKSRLSTLNSLKYRSTQREGEGEGEGEGGWGQ